MLIYQKLSDNKTDTGPFMYIKTTQSAHKRINMQNATSKKTSLYENVVGTLEKTTVFYIHKIFFWIEESSTSLEHKAKQFSASFFTDINHLFIHFQ